MALKSFVQLFSKKRETFTAVTEDDEGAILQSACRSFSSSPHQSIRERKKNFLFLSGRQPTESPCYAIDLFSCS